MWWTRGSRYAGHGGPFSCRSRRRRHRVPGHGHDCYAIENNRIARDYLLHYTNAAFLIREGFKLAEDGLFSGFDSTTATYDRSTWNYEEASNQAAHDLTLEHPRCVFQLLKKNYARYTPEMVERITGIPKDQFLKAADLFTSVRKDGDMKSRTIIYAVGWTHHSFGTQIIRAAAILQLLLGNVGRAGGGVQRLARAFQHTGRNRYGRSVRHPFPDI